jgi:hypothetical protein
MDQWNVLSWISISSLAVDVLLQKSVLIPILRSRKFPWTVRFHSGTHWRQTMLCGVCSPFSIKAMMKPILSQSRWPDEMHCQQEDWKICETKDEIDTDVIESIGPVKYGTSWQWRRPFSSGYRTRADSVRNQTIDSCPRMWDDWDGTQGPKIGHWLSWGDTRIWRGIARIFSQRNKFVRVLRVAFWTPTWACMDAQGWWFCHNLEVIERNFTSWVILFSNRNVEG